MNFRDSSVWLCLLLAGCGETTLTIEDGAVAGAGASDVSQAVTAGRCPNGATVQGIDVSVYQHSVN